MNEYWNDHIIIIGGFKDVRKAGEIEFVSIMSERERRQGILCGHVSGMGAHSPPKRQVVIFDLEKHRYVSGTYLMSDRLTVITK